MSVLRYKFIDSPVGILKLICDEHHLIAILWDRDKGNRVRLGPLTLAPSFSLLLEASFQLEEYFGKKRQSFSVPFKASGTPFQEKVWNLLREIPYGSTCTYRDIAEKLNQPQAVRAVGGAIGRNPLSILVPCHRVIGSNGELTGFAGGLNKKQLLLGLETDRTYQQR